MTSRTLIQELRTLNVPGAAESRARALAAAREAYRQREILDTPPRRHSRLGAIAVATAALVAVISFTPAGHAATGWISELVGLGHIPKHHPPRGHIGGRPTDPTSFGLHEPYPQIVIAKGRTPNGQPYEVSVSRSPQKKYGTCFTLWTPKMDQPNAQGTGQCASRGEIPTVGAFCVANSSGCGDSHHSPRDRIWTTPAVAVLSPEVARLKVQSNTPSGHVGGVRVVHLSHRYQHEVGAPQAVNVGLFFMVHPAKSAVRFTATAYDKKGRVLAHSSDAIGAAAAG